MVEKIPVRIGNVRGLGNIISPSKTLTDFNPINCEITETVEPIYGADNNVYTISYESTNYTIVLSCSSQSVPCLTPVTLTATVTEDNLPVTEAQVMFKVNNVTIAAAVTNSEGVATITYTPETVGVIYLGASCGTNDSNNVSLSVNKVTPTLTLTGSSQTVSSGGSITLSGVLSAGKGFELELFQNQSHHEGDPTVITGDNGQYSLTYTPAVTGGIELAMRFNGNSIYNSVYARFYIVVMVDGSLDITSTKDILSYNDSDTAVISAQLKDGTSTVPAEGINVDFYIGSSSLQRHYDTYADANLQEMVLTGDGAFQWYNETDWVFLNTADGDGNNALNCESLMGKTVNLLREGNVLKVYVDGVDRSDLLLGTQWTRSTLTIEPQEGPISNINLFNTADKDNFCEKIGSDDTDSTGLASVSYASRGIGDIKVMAICGILVSKRYEIQDIYLYDELISEKHTWTKIDNNTTYSFTENGLVTQGSSGGCYLKLDETLPTDCSIEFTIKGLQSISTGVTGGFGIDNSWIEPHTTNTQFSYVGGSSTTVSQVLTTNDVVKIIRQGTTYTYYVNDELKYTKNGKATGKYEYFFVRNIANSGVTFKDLKIREL